MPSLFISFSLYITGFLTFGEPKITGSIQPVCIKTYVFRVYYRRRVEWPREHLEEERFTTCFDAFLIRKQIPHAIRYNVTVRLIRFSIASLFLFRLSMRIHSRVKVFSSCLVLSLSLSNSPENTLIPRPSYYRRCVINFSKKSIPSFSSYKGIKGQREAR